jgi:SAM-dependent methyltransferase
MQKAATEPRPSLWDRHYEESNIPWRSAGVSDTALRLLKQYKGEGRRVLEIGCGTGEDAADFLSLGLEYVGLDFSEAAILQATDHHSSEKARFVHADFFKWAPRETFDIIYEKGVFHGFRGVRRRNVFVRRAASFLSTNGIWVSVCGAADHRRSDFRHGAIFLRDLIGPAEVYFEVLEVIKAEYGLADQHHDFSAWHGAFRRRLKAVSEELSSG